jgi:predicted nucleic acid-binding protein
MSSLEVVLDACVLFSAPLRDTLLRAADANLYRPHWSVEILNEVRRSLVATRRATKAKAQHLVDEMIRYFPEAAVTAYEHLVPVMTNHEGDRHVLAAAVVSGARVVVTHNLRHFPDDALTPYGIQVQPPDEFLTGLFDLAPDAMAQIIRQQANALTRPVSTVDRVLDRLSLDAPDFVAHIRAYLRSHQP